MRFTSLTGSETSARKSRYKGDGMKKNMKFLFPIYFKKLDQTWDDIEIKEKDMINLTKNRGPFIKFFLDLIPCRLRKV